MLSKFYLALAKPYSGMLDPASYTEGFSVGLAKLDPNIPPGLEYFSNLTEVSIQDRANKVVFSNLLLLSIVLKKLTIHKSTKTFRS